jgi:UDP-N-acetylmuramate dehydrogenase
MENSISKLKKKCLESNITFKDDVDLSLLTYLKSGGKCEMLTSPKTTQELSILKRLCKEFDVVYTIIGETSNMIFLDDVKYGVIISTESLNCISFINHNTISVGAGVNLSSFLRILYSKGITGFEGLEGIPGTVGGAVFMNAGAYGYEISTYVKEVEYVDDEGVTQKIDKKDCNFTQRMSIFREQREKSITKIVFELPEVCQERVQSIQEKVEIYHIARHSYQEFAFPNVGSIFTAKRCIYEEYCKADKFFSLKYRILKFVFYNRLMRFVNRKAPNKIRLNKLILNHFNINNHEKVISNKHINMFAKKSTNSWELVDYIYDVKAILKERIVLENEIVTNSIVEDEKSLLVEYSNKINFAKSYD